MEGISEDNSPLMSSWPLETKGPNRNPYKRVNKQGFFSRKGFRKPRVQRTGSKGRRSWGLRITKIRIRFVSPFKLLARLRDAYVKMMMKLAGSSALVGSAMGPMIGSNSTSISPKNSGTLTKSNSRGKNEKANGVIFNEAELMYLEYMRRDPAFMRSILGT